MHALPLNDEGSDTFRPASRLASAIGSSLRGPLYPVFPVRKMLNFFGKLSSPVASKPTTEADAAAAGEILSRAEAKLQLLRTGSGQDFPLLNEATRLGEEASTHSARSSSGVAQGT